MGGIEEIVKAELMVIEDVYELRIVNRDEAAALIASKLDSKARALRVCTAINTWISMNKKADAMVIPEEVLMRFIGKNI
jgi:hypothetical protein